MRRYIKMIKASICGIAYYAIMSWYAAAEQMEQEKGSEEKARRYWHMKTVYAGKAFSVLYDCNDLQKTALELNAYYVKKYM